MKISVRKQVLRLVLGGITFLLPIVLPLGLFLFGNDPIFHASVSDYFQTEIGLLLVGLLVLFSVALILYASTSKRNRMELFSTAFLVLLIVILGMIDALGQHYSWLGIVLTGCFLLMYAALGGFIRNTFNLPLRFPALTKIGTLIWILTGVILVTILAFQHIWPPMVFVLEAIVLRSFTAGILIRHKINKKLGG